MKTLNLYLIIIIALAFSCCQPAPQYNADDWALSQKAKDSLNFRASHHYTINYNFCITADSLLLQIARPYHNLQLNDAAGFAAVFKNNRIAVADILIVPEDTTDSVWVKVARDQITAGWLHEKELLQSVRPDFPVSKLIHAFRCRIHTILSLCFCLPILCLVICRIRHTTCPFVHIADIPSAYPTLLCLAFALASLFHAALLRFRPEEWQEFYFHPTLSPFRLPLVPTFFVTALWLVLLLALASAQVIYKELSWQRALCYVCSLLGVCAACYVLFASPNSFYASIPLFLIYAIWALRRYFIQTRSHYICGNCGARLTQLGTCPRCGVWNETN